MLRRLLFGLTLAAALPAVASCEDGEVESSVVLTSPPSASTLGDTFGPAVDTTLRADSNSEPRDPAASDVAPVSFTTEPIPVPAS